MEQYTKARQETTDLVLKFQGRTRVPLPPSELMKPLHEYLGPKYAGRRLTFEQETQLADDFAFLAYTTDDIKLIKAVAIEEDDGGMNIRIASNTGKAQVDELQQLADTMMLATSRSSCLFNYQAQLTYKATSRQHLRSKAFSFVVKMCYTRILSRLRSKHAILTMKIVNKPALPVLLSDSISRCAVKGAHQSAVRKSSQRMLTLFKQFESSKDSATLESILRMASEFDCSTLSTMMSITKVLDPSTAMYLPRAMTKLGRYYDATIRLLNAAANLRFRHITVFALQPYQLSINSPSHRLQQKEHFSAGNLKVHAEIQLLLYYEMQAKSPRVICASKKACYLCRLFFSIHEKFAVPASHGRLYEKWTLPDWTEQSKDCLTQITPALIKFNERLCGAIAKKKYGRREDPNESTFQLHTQWPSQSTLIDCQVLTSTENGLNTSSISRPLQLNGVELFIEVSASWCGSMITLDAGRSADSLDVEALKVGEERRLEILHYPARLDLRAQGRCFGLILDR